MPTTAAGKRVMRDFISRYGKRGKAIFFGRVNSGGPKFARAMGETSVRAKAGKST